MVKKGIKVGGDFAGSAYDAAATFGRVVAFVKMVFGCIIGIVLTVVGIVLIRQKKVYTGSTTAKVTDPKCTSYTDTNKGRSTTRTECAVNAIYTVDGKEYNGSLVVRRNIADGQMIPIQYVPSNPTDMREPVVASKTVGIVLIFLGLFIAIGTIIWFILTLRYKVVAAGTGAVTAADWAFGSRGNYNSYYG